MAIYPHEQEAVSLLGPPYDRLLAPGHVGDPDQLGGGWIMVWHLGRDGWQRAADQVAGRPAGVTLALILPDSDESPSVTRTLRAIERTRPQVVLPFHEAPRPREIAAVIRRPPPSLGASVSEYLDWRGVSMDPVTTRIVRRTIDLSPTVQTITALAKSLYISRRALGRRFLSGGLPVPSHWLHIARVLRATIKLQNSDASLFHVACTLGYPDGFSLSNQMHRLCGIRPSETRIKLGWEWVLETWLMMEAQGGSLPGRVMRSRRSIASGVRLPRATEVGDASPPAVLSM